MNFLETYRIYAKPQRDPYAHGTIVNIDFKMTEQGCTSTKLHDIFS